MNLLAFKRRNLQEKNIVVTVGSSVRNGQVVGGVTDGTPTYKGNSRYFVVTLYLSKPLRKISVNLGTGASAVYNVLYRDDKYIGYFNHNPKDKSATFNRGFNKILWCIHKSYKNSVLLKNSRGKIIWMASDENFQYN